MIVVAMEEVDRIEFFGTDSVAFDVPESFPEAAVSEGDEVVVRFGMRDVWEGVVDGITHRNEYPDREDFVTIEAVLVSKTSSCSMTSELGTIAKFADSLRGLLESGGCCNGALLDRAILRQVLIGVLDEADERYGRPRPIPPKETIGYHFAHHAGRLPPGMQFGAGGMSISYSSKKSK